MSQNQELLKTPLHELHLELGAKMVPFAGYSMPVQYPMGVMKEHLHTRARAGLFDVSHMGQAFLRGKEGNDIAEAFEALVPGNIIGLKPGRMRYTMFLNDNGGIFDDLMVTRWQGEENTLFLVVNAGCKDADFDLIKEKLGTRAELDILDDRALVALQGPSAAQVLSSMVPAVAEMGFMSLLAAEIDGISCFISRCGYTGEDGFEISIPGAGAEAISRKLLAHADVEPVGLGARDSLRLEVGLCLYGSDLDETTSPVEADLLFSIAARRREAGDFPGGERFLRELADGPGRKRVGILPDGRAPARGHAEIQDAAGNLIGEITSGGFGPSYGGPVAMGYVKASHSEVGTAVNLMVRGKAMPAKIAAMPFVEQNYYRKPKIS
jgi:glycine cleavage system T protein (aminomethyltransferase)